MMFECGADMDDRQKQQCEAHDGVRALEKIERPGGSLKRGSAKRKDRTS